MDRMLYIAMTGAKNALQSQQKVNNNLANADTPGFKSDYADFVSQEVEGPGYRSRTYAQIEAHGSDFKQGGMISTGRDMDVAARGNTWIAVQAPDGTEAYTRRGDLRVSETGILENGSGDILLGINGPINIPPHADMDIGVDGSVMVQPLGAASNTRLLIDRIKLVVPEQGQIRKGVDGYFRTEQNRPLDPNADGRITTGVLEGSNVNMVEAMVGMIENARTYEMQVKVMKSVDEKETNAARLLRAPK